MIVLVKLFKILKIKKTQLLLGFLLLFICCDRPDEKIIIKGSTMGTSYVVKIVANKDIETKKIKYSIDSILVKLNKQMSTWDPESEISKFNRWESLEPYDVSRQFYEVVESALFLSKKTNGMFDATVFDLSSLWGFGPNPKSGIPEKKNIDSILTLTGYENIICTNGILMKKNRKVKLDLNAIAKGYGVDVIFNFLRTSGFENIFVEIGGEVKFTGYNFRNENWSVGLENPISNQIDKQIPFFGVLKNEGCAIATSANYRNFVDLDGTILGHTINPKSGFPIQTNVLSVTVISKTCMESDGWATALMTMSYEQGASILSGNDSVSAIWLMRGTDGLRYITMEGEINIIDPIYDIR
tara:strand:- start:27 stop:1091 length:1065 start_codon:yes stop_codon:yes gene_type:complete